ncbi:MAG: metal ABC transporter permease [Lentisphaerae bacterium]|nr:metal ABC transporter permease [Lentisphaerota bacterium]
MILGVDPLFARAFWGALALGLLAPVVGRNLILGRSVMLGLAVPQVALTGVAFVMLGAGLGWSWCLVLPNDVVRASVGALLFTLPALAIPAAHYSGRRGDSWEPTLAVLYLAAVAGANLMLASHAFGKMYVDDLFHGRMLLINTLTLSLLGGTLLLVGAVALVTRRRLLLVLTDPEFAAACGVHVRAWRVGIALMNGCAIGVAVGAVGPNVTFGFLILPVLMAATWSRSLHGHLHGAMIGGGLLAVTGFHLSYHFDLPLGDTIIAVGCGALVFCRLVARLRRRRVNPMR